MSTLEDMLDYTHALRVAVAQLRQENAQLKAKVAELEGAAKAKEAECHAPLPRRRRAV